MSALEMGDVKLRAFEPEDIERLYVWENTPEAWEVSSLKQPLSKFILASYIKSGDSDIWENRQMRLVIEFCGEPVGTVELFDFDPYHQRAGVGIIIHEKDFRGKGIAQKAISIMLEYAYKEIGVLIVFANISVDNQSSIQLFKSLGFEQTGTKKAWLKDGENRKDELFFQKKIG